MNHLRNLAFTTVLPNWRFNTINVCFSAPLPLESDACTSLSARFQYHFLWSSSRT